MTKKTMGSMSYNRGMGYNKSLSAVSSMESIGRISDSSYRSTKGLRLSDSSVLSLVGLGDRLVRYLTSRSGMVSRSHSMGNYRGSMGNNSWGMVGRGCNNWSMVGRGSMGNNRGSIGRGIRIGSSAIISHLGHITIVVINLVVDMLDPAIRKSNRVGALSTACSITGLSSIEVGVRVVVSNSIVVSVGRDLISIDLSSSISRGSMGNNRGMVGGGSMDHRGSVDHRGSMDKRGSMHSMR